MALDIVKGLVYFDRNPLIVPQLYTANLAPHGATIRWTYTVPANRRAFLEYAFVRTARQTVAGVFGVCASYIVYTSNGVTGFILFTQNANNVAQDVNVNQIGAGVFFSAGDVIQAVTLDTSTGGTVLYHNSAKFTEFDP